MEATAWVYVLKLDNGRYYVGSTRWLMLRIEQHLAGHGAHDTKINKPTDIVQIYPCLSRAQAYSLEAYLQYQQKRTHNWTAPSVTCGADLARLHALAQEHKLKMLARRETYIKRKMVVARIGRSVQARRSIKQIAHAALQRFIMSL